MLMLALKLPSLVNASDGLPTSLCMMSNLGVQCLAAERASEAVRLRQRLIMLGQLE